MKVDEVADFFDRANFDLCGKLFAHLLTGQPGGDRKHEHRALDQFLVGDHGDAHAIGTLQKLNLERVLLQHHRQRPAQIVHQRREASGEIVVVIGRIVTGSSTVAGKCREVPRQHQELRVQPLRVQGA